MSGAKSCHPFSVESLLGLSKTIQGTAQEQKEKKTEPQAQLHNYDLNHQTLSGYAEDKRGKSLHTMNNCKCNRFFITFCKVCHFRPLIYLYISPCMASLFV